MERKIAFTEVPYESLHKQIYLITELKNHEKLVTWSSKSTKLLISLQWEKPTSSTMAKYEEKLHGIKLQSNLMLTRR